MPSLLVVDVILKCFGYPKPHLFKDIEHAAEVMGACFVTHLVLSGIPIGRRVARLDYHPDIIQHLLAQCFES